MHSVLLVVERPTDGNGNPLTAWTNFAIPAKALLERASAVETLGENLWLISLREAMPHLCRLVSLAEKNRLDYKTLFLDEPPVWCKSATADTENKS